MPDEAVAGVSGRPATEQISSSAESSSQYCRNEQIRSPWNSATVAPWMTTRTPVGSITARPDVSSGPVWVMATLHSAQA